MRLSVREQHYVRAYVDAVSANASPVEPLELLSFARRAEPYFEE